MTDLGGYLAHSITASGQITGFYMTSKGDFRAAFWPSSRAEA